MPIAVVVDGRALPSVTTVSLQGGTLIAPFTGFVDRIVTQSAVLPDGVIELRRGVHVLIVTCNERRAEADGASVLLPVAPQRTPYTILLPLAAVARALGERIAFDATTQTVSLTASAAPEIVPMTPVPPSFATISPSVIFTPQPPKTPVPVVTPPLHPRRTPIPVFPDPMLAPL